jgi:hypothetical protein
MNVEESARIDMYAACLDFLATNATLTAAIPTLNTVLTSATALLTQIQQISTLQDEDITGAEVDKITAKQTLVNNCIALSGSLTAYATALNNNVLLKMVNFVPSTFRRASDAKLKEDANILYVNSLPLVLALVPYGVTAASLTAFNTSIPTFNTAKLKPKTGIAMRKQQTTQLKTLIKQIDTSFKTKIDKLMLLARNTAPVLYTDYDNLRKINNPPSQKIAFKIHVTDADTLKPLPGMRFAIDGQAKPLKSSKKGNCQKKHLPFGVLKGHATKAGYVTQDFTFAITQGQTTRLAIVLKTQTGVITPSFGKTVANTY